MGIRCLVALLVLAPGVVSAQEGAEHDVSFVGRSELALAPTEPVGAWRLRIEVDLVDPFLGWWDPLAIALSAELLEPFSGPARFEFVSLIDPFASPQAVIDLMDPWAPRGS